MTDAETEAIRALNRKARDDARVEACLLTVGDGILLVRKLPGHLTPLADQWSVTAIGQVACRPFFGWVCILCLSLATMGWANKNRRWHSICCDFRSDFKGQRPRGSSPLQG